MARHARQVLAALEGAIGEIDQLRGLQRGTVRIGALHPAGDLDVPRLLARFRQLHPAIEVGLLEGTADECSTG